jgi:hypothetical protein
LIKKQFPCHGIVVFVKWQKLHQTVIRRSFLTLKMPPLTEIAGEKIELQDAYAQGFDLSLSELISFLTLNYHQFSSLLRLQCQFIVYFKFSASGALAKLLN